MKISWLTISESAGMHADGRPYIIGLYTNKILFNPPQMIIPLYGLIKIESDTPSNGKPHTLTLRMCDGDGNMVGESHTTLVLPKSDKKVEGWLIAGGQMRIINKGLYQIRILIDGSNVETWPTWSLEFVDESPKANT